MAAWRYPCLECGRPTESEDRYIVCDDCLAELEEELREQRRRMATADALRLVGRPVPLSPDEVGERLRRLLDDW